MISRRNFAIIAVVMGIVFFLFQFSQFVRDMGNTYTENEYIGLKIPDRNDWKQEIKYPAKGENYDNEKYILFLGDTSTDTGSIVSQWTLYSKRNLAVIDKIDDIKLDKGNMPEFLLVDSNFVDYEKETKTLEEMLEKGISIVFLNLPDVEVVESVEGLEELLGISYIQEKSVTVEGIKLFSGFLLGGEEIYKPKKTEEEKRQDLCLDMPWYVTAGGSKTYMVGLMEHYYDDYIYQNDYYPAIIWRNSHSKGQVFCINGNYMAQTTGLGILSSIIFELSDYQLYPVVNAQNTLVVNFPLMADENNEEFFGIYSRSAGAFQTDVAWPTLIALAEKDSLKYTCFISPKYNYNDPAQPKYDNYNTLLKLFNERGTELGLSMEHAEGISLLDKLASDKSFYDGLEHKYECTSGFMDINDQSDLDKAVKDAYVKNVRTIACDADVQIPILSYVTDDITRQCLTSNTKNFTYSKDLMLKSIETVLGYDNAKIDLSDVVWPESEADHWENIYDDMSSSLVTYWKPYRAFERTTLTESDQRVRTFLNLQSSSERSGDTVKLSVSGANKDECWFILRTHGEKIDSIEGATYVKIENDAYLLTVTEEEVTIVLKSTQTINN